MLTRTQSMCLQLSFILKTMLACRVLEFSTSVRTASRVNEMIRAYFYRLRTLRKEGHRNSGTIRWRIDRDEVDWHSDGTITR
jgi:hypothetical protein